MQLKHARFATAIIASRIFAFRILASTIIASLSLAAAGAGEESELPPDSIAPRLYATGFAFAEGPAFDEDGNLYVVNYREKGTIGRIASDGKAEIFCDLRELCPAEGREPRGNGLKIDAEGRLIVADQGAGRLLRVSRDGKQVEVLADRCAGRRFQEVNDVCLDLQGNIYFTDPAGSGAENPVGSFYLYDIRTKGVSELDTGLAYPNGIAVTPDQKHLCVSETMQYRVLIYELSDERRVQHRRVLIDFQRAARQNYPIGKFMPDGMAFDADGRLYVAMWTNGVVNVIDPAEGNAEGKIVRQYDAGGLKTTNCCFFDGKLYTTVASKEAVFRLDLGVRGFDYNGKE